MNNSPEPVQQERQTWFARLWQSLTGPHYSIQEIGARRQVQLMASVSLGYIIISLISIVATFIMHRSFGSGTIMALPIVALVLAAYILSRTRYQRIGAWPLGIAIASSFLGQFQDGTDLGSSLLLSTALAFIVANALMSQRAMIIFVILETIISPFFVKLLVPATNIARLGTYSIYILTVGILSILLMIYRDNVEKHRLEELRNANRELTNIRTNLEKHVEERTSELSATTEESRKRAAQLVAISEVSRAIAQLQNLGDLLPAVTDLISQRFGFYHVGIFLLDENRKHAVLRATNSEGGKIMLERGFRVEVGQDNIIGYVAERGESRISQEPWTDFAQKQNPNLPATRSEMALPLLVGQMVIGILDIQSESPAAFGPQDLRIMSTLADQVAIAIENVRLYAETRQALADSQTAYQRSLKGEWARLAQESERLGYQFTAEGIMPLSEALTGPDVESALETGEMVEAESEIPTLAVPVKLRNETIGILNIRAFKPERRWSDNELAIVQAAAERVALALENARLLSDASRRAEQERTISDITTKIGSSSQLDIIMRTAVEELGRIYNDSEIVLQIGGKGDGE